MKLYRDNKNWGKQNRQKNKGLEAQHKKTARNTTKKSQNKEIESTKA